MKIAHKNTVKFGDITIGTIFMWALNGCYIKTERIYDNKGDECTAINLENGLAIMINKNEPVRVIDCTLVCE